MTSWAGREKSTLKGPSPVQLTTRTLQVTMRKRERTERAIAPLTAFRVPPSNDRYSAARSRAQRGPDVSYRSAQPHAPSVAQGGPSWPQVLRVGAPANRCTRPRPAAALGCDMIWSDSPEISCPSGWDHL